MSSPPLDGAGDGAETGASRPDGSGDTAGPPTGEVLELLDDECARAILRSTVDEARPARDLIAAVDASRATVYRRLDRLVEAGLLERAGNSGSRRNYRATLDSVTVSLEGGPTATTVDVTRRSD